MHAPYERPWKERFTRSTYFVGAVLLHLILFLLLATVVIWKAPNPPATTEFHAVSIKVPPPPPQPPASGEAANNPQFEPQPVVVPVVTPPSIVTTIDNNAFKVDAPKVLDQALSHLSNLPAQGTTLFSKAGSNADNGSFNGNSLYGTSSGLGLVGNFYDLKQTPDGGPTDMAETDQEKQIGPDSIVSDFATTPPFPRFLDVLKHFIHTWDMSLLDRYYKSPVTLSLSQVCIPDQSSSAAPKAFHADNVVARRWIAIYRAGVMPPDSGEYRFIGFADDFLVVRVDDQNVLDACWGGEELDLSARRDDDVGQGFGSAALHAGRWFQVEQGTPINVQILIGEGPGGASGFILMIQKQGDGSPKGDYPVFQVLDAHVPDMGLTTPFSKKKMLFPTVQ